MTTQKLDRRKLRDAIRMIIDQCEPSALGQVKLHKALYYLDMLSFLHTGRSVTGSTYKKRPYGPTNEHLQHTLKSMSRDGELEIKTVDYFGYPKCEFLRKSRQNSQRHLRRRHLVPTRHRLRIPGKTFHPSVASHIPTR